jgi:hypothetical protein
MRSVSTTISVLFFPRLPDLRSTPPLSLMAGDSPIALASKMYGSRLSRLAATARGIGVDFELKSKKIWAFSYGQSGFLVRSKAIFT